MDPEHALIEQLAVMKTMARQQEGARIAELALRLYAAESIAMAYVRNEAQHLTPEDFVPGALRLLRHVDGALLQGTDAYLADHPVPTGDLEPALGLPDPTTITAEPFAGSEPLPGEEGSVLSPSPVDTDNDCAP